MRSLIIELRLFVRGVAAAAEQIGRVGLALEAAFTPRATGWRRVWCVLTGHQPDLLASLERDEWTCRCRAARETGERRQRLRER